MSMDRGIRAIAVLKIFKGVLLLLTGIGLSRLLHRDTAEIVRHYINVLHVDPENRHLHGLLMRASILNEHQLKELRVGSFFYAGLLLAEGSALLLQKRWAKHFTMIITASFIPLEIWELMKRVTILKSVVIAVNIAIIWYLAGKIKHPSESQRASA